MPKFEKILQDNMGFLNSIQGSNEGRRIEISSYNPIQFEMNITPVIAEMLRTSTLPLNHSLPKVVNLNEALVFRTYKWGDDLAKSEFFDVLEPTDDKDMVYPQVLIVPLMGFMEDCHRIGYGGGFYDRSITQLREKYGGKILMIGVCFEAQKFDKFTGRVATNDVWQEN
jgi:5-formyltetrahydrofolate cyclo-ligase